MTSESGTSTKPEPTAKTHDGLDEHIRTHVRSRLTDAMLKAVEDTRSRIIGFLIGGNAGGAIASLSLIGTTLAKSPSGAPPSYPEAFFWILLVFLVGLLGAYQMAQWEHQLAVLQVQKAGRDVTAMLKSSVGPILDNAYKKAVDEGRLNPSVPIDSARGFGWIGALIATVCLFGGIIAGLVILFRMAR